MAKVKKAQDGLKLLAKYAGKSTAKKLESSLAKSKIKKGLEEEAFRKLPYSQRIKTVREGENAIPLKSVFGSARKDFQSATRGSGQTNPALLGRNTASSIKSSIRKNYKTGGVVKSAAAKKSAVKKSSKKK